MFQLIDPDFVESAISWYNYNRFELPRQKREQKRLIRQFRELTMSDPLEHLQELASEFTIEYQRFRDADVTSWVVTLKPNSLKGRGDTIQEAIQDLSRQQDLREFEAKLAHARLGAKDTESLKDNIRNIL